MWVSLLAEQGGRQPLAEGDFNPKLQLQFSPQGLAETTAAEPYTATYYFEVFGEQEDLTDSRIVPMSVQVEVRATVSADTSVWGEAGTGTCQHLGQTRVLYLGQLSKVPFTACDADSLPVNHQLPRPGARDVADVNEVARVGAVAVDAAGQALEEPADEFGDELLRILVRAKDVVAARDDDGHLEGGVVGLDDLLGRRLGRRVRVGRLEHVPLLAEIGRASCRERV